MNDRVDGLKSLNQEFLLVAIMAWSLDIGGHVYWCHVLKLALLWLRQQSLLGMSQFSIQISALDCVATVQLHTFCFISELQAP